MVDLPSAPRRLNTDTSGKSVVFGGAAEVVGLDAGAEGGRFEAEKFGGAAGAFETPAGFLEDG